MPYKIGVRIVCIDFSSYYLTLLNLRVVVEKYSCVSFLLNLWAVVEKYSVSFLCGIFETDLL